MTVRTAWSRTMGRHLDVTDTNYSSGAPGQTVRQTSWTMDDEYDAVRSRDIDGGQGVEEQEQEHRSSEDTEENTETTVTRCGRVIRPLSWRPDYC